jgi:tetratricopeptide (TPR) repeat protein
MLIILGVIAILDAVLLMAMSKTDFDQKYNRPKGKAARRFRQPARGQRTLHRTPERKEGDPAIVRGIKLYRREHYQEAIFEFKRALEEDPQSAAAHFNLACCYSILHNAEEAYEHLAQAVELGFDDRERLLTHEALSYLHRRSDFAAFRDNGFRLVHQLAPGNEEDLLEQARQSGMSILDQLEALGDRLDKGELSRDEFEIEKKKILGS